MAYMYEVDSFDAFALDSLREELTARRKEAGLQVGVLSKRMGRNEEFVSSLERGRRDSPRLSSLQLWAHGLGLRVEFGLDNFWLFSHGSGEVSALYALSRPWGEHELARLWLVGALGLWRQRRGVELVRVAAVMGMTADGVRRWELESTDPVVKRVMVAARACGTRLTMSLWERDEWVFG